MDMRQILVSGVPFCTDTEGQSRYKWRRSPTFMRRTMTLTLKPLEQQVLVVTGASSGIGLVTARQATQCGACVVLAARNEMDLRHATDDIRRRGGRAAYVVADVSDARQVDAIADTALREFGRIDTW